MRLQMGGIDHKPGWFAGLMRQLGENLVEDAEAAPAHEPIVDRLVWAIVARCITSTQTVPDDEDDPTDHPPIVNPRNPVRQRKIRLDPAHPRLGQ